MISDHFNELCLPLAPPESSYTIKELLSNQVSQSVGQSVSKSVSQSRKSVSKLAQNFFSGKTIAFLVPKKILNIIWALQRDLDEKIVFQPPAEIPFRAFLKDFPRGILMKNLQKFKTSRMTHTHILKQFWGVLGSYWAQKWIFNILCLQESP